MKKSIKSSKSIIKILLIYIFTIIFTYINYMCISLALFFTEVFACILMTIVFNNKNSVEQRYQFCFYTVTPFLIINIGIFLRKLFSSVFIIYPVFLKIIMIVFYFFINSIFIIISLILCYILSVLHAKFICYIRKKEHNSGNDFGDK